MSVNPCRECGKPVSNSATKCPHCGTQNPNVAATISNIAVVVAFALFMGAVVWFLCQ